MEKEDINRLEKNLKKNGLSQKELTNLKNKICQNFKKITEDFENSEKIYNDFSEEIYYGHLVFLKRFSKINEYSLQENYNQLYEDFKDETKSKNNITMIVGFLTVNKNSLNISNEIKKISGKFLMENYSKK